MGVLSFGEDVRYLHSLDAPFASSTGGDVLSHFTFAQQRSCFVELLEALVAILVQSRLRLSAAAKKTIQIVFVISDGRVDAAGRGKIARLTREAQENNILIVLLIADEACE